MQNVAGPQDRTFARRDHALLRYCRDTANSLQGIDLQGWGGTRDGEYSGGTAGVASHAGTCEQRKYIAEIPPVMVHFFIYPKTGM